MTNSKLKKKLIKILKKKCRECYVNGSMITPVFDGSKLDITCRRCIKEELQNLSAKKRLK